MSSTDLELEKPGTLPRPGPVGRLVRLAFGALCLSYVWGLIAVSGDVVTDTQHIRPIIWNGILIGLFLISYVINIGFSRAWKKWPAIISAGVFLLIGVLGYLLEKTFATSYLANAIWLWELYLFSHLGLAFTLAAVLATPGCEMRAFHDLYSKTTGIPTLVHVCPVGPLQRIDRWEARRRQGGR